jgi:HEAT repeat protein
MDTRRSDAGDTGDTGDTGVPGAPGARRRDVVLAGHAGDVETCRDALNDPDAATRIGALGGLERNDALTDEQVRRALGDPVAAVRARAAELAANREHVELLDVLNDGDDAVVEWAAWACGEHQSTPPAVLDRLATLATTHRDPLVREAAVAALGAIGNDRGLPSILSAMGDKPAIRRRAVIALTPFDGPEVQAAQAAALTDRDWQVRQIAEDLRD